MTKTRVGTHQDLPTAHAKILKSTLVFYKIDNDK